MLPSVSILIALLGFVSYVSLVQCQNKNLSDLSDRWRELERGQPLGPEKTFELIKELQEYYKNRTEKGALNRRYRLYKLARLDEKNEEKCSERSWNGMLRLLSRFEGDNVNIVPYIMKKKDELADYCEGKGEKNWYKTDISTWRELYAKLFSDESNPFGVDKTLELMKEAYGKIEESNDRLTKAKKDLLESLIDISDLNAEKCSRESIILLDELLNEHDDERANILPYIVYWKTKRTDYCKERETQRKGTTKLVDLTDAEVLYSQIFSPKAQQLGNETILEALRHLLVLYKKRDSPGRPSFRQGHIQNLVDLNDFKKQDCASGSWERFSSLMDRYDSYTANILPYLLYSKGELAKFCNGKNKINIFEANSDDWKAIDRQIFTMTGPELGPKRTLELLKELLRIYETRSDPDTMSRKRSIERLVNVSYVTLDRCNKAAWDNLYYLYELHQYDDRNVRPYLDSVRVEMAKLCADKGTWYEADLGEWAKLDDQLYDFRNNATPLGNDKTLELMKYLLDQYQRYAPSHTLWKRKKLGTYIELSKLSKEKCNQKEKDDLQRLLASNEASTVNVIPYLKHWQEMQEKYCSSS